jgi:ADP-heptose:LPS heptosyltransferase
MFAGKNPDEIRDVRKIGVYVGLPRMGDLLLIIPLFRALKQLFPGAKTVFIGKIVHGYVRPIFDNCPYIDELLEFHLYEALSIPAFSRFVRTLRREKYDLIVDTQRKFVPSLLMSLGGARYMVSYSSKGIFSQYDVPVPDRGKRHIADISLDLARAVGAKNPPLGLEISIPDENKKYAESFYSENGVAPGDLLIGFIPSAGNPLRYWNSEKFGRLADMLSEKTKAKIICFGALKDKSVIDEIIENTAYPILVEDYSRKSVFDSAVLMSRCNAIVGVDSGPLHLADSVGVPCVGLYGPTFPERFGLLGRRKKEICLYMDCAPCKNFNCEHRKCLENITPEQVFNETVLILGETGMD